VEDALDYLENHYQPLPADVAATWHAPEGEPLDSDDDELADGPEL
jgi:hypothetical protein